MLSMFFLTKMHGSNDIERISTSIASLYLKHKGQNTVLYNHHYYTAIIKKRIMSAYRRG